MGLSKNHQTMIGGGCAGGGVGIQTASSAYIAVQAANAGTCACQLSGLSAYFGSVLASGNVAGTFFNYGSSSISSCSSRSRSSWWCFSC